MQTNIVLFELVDSCLNVFRVPETVVPAETLHALSGLVFNHDDTTAEDWDNFEVVNLALATEAMVSNGVEKLAFPFQPLPGETVFRVSIAA